MIRCFIFYLLLIVSTLGFSQSFYVISQRDVPLTNKTFLLNINNCDSIQVHTCAPTNNTLQLPENQFTDITMDFTSLYCVSGWGSLYKRNFTDTTSCQYLGNFGYNINALATSNTGVIFATGQVNGVCKLFKYQSGTFTMIGNLPQNYYSAGDLFFYENRLFMTGTNSNFTSGYIVEVDVNTPSQSCIYMALQNLQPWAAFSINNGNISRVFITSINNNSGPHTSSLYEINMQEKTIGSLVCTYPYFINGAATVYNFSIAGNTLCDATSLGTPNGFEKYFKVANPVNNQIKIETNIAPLEIQNVMIFDASGKIVSSFENNEYQAEIGISDLAAGLYILRLTTVLGGEFKQRIIKQD